MMPKVTVNISDIRCELYSDVESKALELRKESTCSVLTRYRLKAWNLAPNIYDVDSKTKP